MSSQLPQSNVLAAIGSAVVASVICTWTISTHFQSQTQREFDRIHARLDAMTGKRTEYASERAVAGEGWASDAWEMPEAPAEATPE